MKLWIRNILQYIVNSIESEEDKTLPEDYFKDIIIKLQQLPKLPKRKMTEEQRQEVWKLYQIHKALKPEFSCSMCKHVLKISTCKNCPIYCQTFSHD